MLCGLGLAPLSCGVVLTQEVLEQADGRQLLLRGAAGLQPIALEAPGPRWTNMVFEMGEPPTAIQQWLLPWHCKGLQQWWCAGDVAHVFHQSLAPDQAPRYLLNSWGRWSGYCEFVAPCLVALRKGIDRRGRDKHWSRMLPEHSVSTTGLLAILLGQALHCRVPAPDSVLHVLCVFLNDRLRGAHVDLLLPLDQTYVDAYCFAGGQAPVPLCARLPVDGSRIHVEPFLAQAQGLTKVRLAALFSALTDRGDIANGAADLGALLFSLYKDTHLAWLSKALLQQVARLVEAHSQATTFTSNPLEGDRTWGGRVDVDLTAHLCSGLGATPGNERGAPATFVEGHVASFLRLRKAHKKWSKKGPPKVSCARGTNTMLVRYHMAAKSVSGTVHDLGHRTGRVQGWWQRRAPGRRLGNHCRGCAEGSVGAAASFDLSECLRKHRPHTRERRKQPPPKTTPKKYLRTNKGAP